MSSNAHCDLGIILSTWKDHYNHISSKAYRTLGLLRRTFSRSINISTKWTLYLALVRSQLLYCSPLWHPSLIQDISTLERIQCQATKNDYISDYKTRLIKLNVLPECILMIFVISSSSLNQWKIYLIILTSEPLSNFASSLPDLFPVTNLNMVLHHLTKKFLFQQTT